MEVILKETVKKLGKVGDVVKVAEGYARNFLIPQNKAVQITKKNLEAIQDQLKNKAVKASAEEKNMKEMAEKLTGAEVTIKKLASEDDKLFGSVTETDIAEELKKQGFDVDKTNIVMKKHIKELGVSDVDVHLKYDAEAKIKVWVVREDEKKG